MLFSGNYVDLQMTLDQAHEASHPGQCDTDVRGLSRVPAIARQLKKLDALALRRELKDYGAWDESELEDHDQNLQRILWIAAGDIVDHNFEKYKRSIR